MSSPLDGRGSVTSTCTCPPAARDPVGRRSSDGNRRAARRPLTHRRRVRRAVLSEFDFAPGEVSCVGRPGFAAQSPCLVCGWPSKLLSFADHSVSVTTRSKSSTNFVIRRANSRLSVALDGRQCRPEATGLLGQAHSQRPGRQTRRSVGGRTSGLHAWNCTAGIRAADRSTAAGSGKHRPPRARVIRGLESRDCRGGCVGPGLRYVPVAH